MALPGAAVVEGGRLAGVAHRYSDRSTSLISLLALRGAKTELPELTQTLDAELRTDGRKPYLLDTSDMRQSGATASEVCGESDVAVSHVSNGVKAGVAAPGDGPGPAAASRPSTGVKPGVAVSGNGPGPDAVSGSSNGENPDVAVPEDGPGPHTVSQPSNGVDPAAGSALEAPKIHMGNVKPTLRPSPRPRPRPALAVDAEEAAAPAVLTAMYEPTPVPEHVPAAERENHRGTSRYPRRRSSVRPTGTRRGRRSFPRSVGTVIASSRYSAATLSSSRAAGSFTSRHDSPIAPTSSC